MVNAAPAHELGLGFGDGGHRANAVKRPARETYPLHRAFECAAVVGLGYALSPVGDLSFGKQIAPHGAHAIGRRAGAKKTPGEKWNLNRAHCGGK